MLRKPNDHPRRTSYVQRNLRSSSLDGASFGAMVGLGETFVPAFALAAGMGETAAGLISAVPVAAGGIMQLLSLRLFPYFRSEQQWVMLCASIQATSFLPLLLAAAYGSVSFPLLLLIMIVYWTGGLASGAVWNNWMEKVVPRPVRAVYFAKRSRFQQQSTLLGLVLGGALLEFAKTHDALLAGFATLFAAAAIFRYASVGFLGAIRAYPDGSTLNRVESARSLNKPAAQTGGKLIVYLVFVQAFVQISGPFFAPYMLEQVRMSYVNFVYFLALAFLARILSLSYWGHFARKFGAGTLMWVGAIALVPLSALWILSSNYVWLSIIQLVSGVSWAAYELGFFLLFFETLPQDKRTRMLTYYNCANTAAMLLGALMGAGIFAIAGGGVLGYFILFGVSSAGRLLGLLLLWRVELTPVPIAHLAVRVLGIRPATATLDVPVLTTLEDQDNESQLPQPG